MAPTSTFRVAAADDSFMTRQLDRREREEAGKNATPFMAL